MRQNLQTEFVLSESINLYGFSNSGIFCIAEHVDLSAKHGFDLIFDL